jgi:UDP-N-acetylmuramyl pentapeptide phosphotransferase/UDP-N-acetylglucosamine-1-phosphate transferase
VTLLACAAGGAAGGWLVWRAGRRLWARPSFRRRNFRGVDVPTATGVAVVLPVAAAVAVHGWDRAWGPFLIVAVAFGAFGLVDDLAGPHHAGPGEGPSGFGGHLGALAQGRATTGLLKLAGGAAAALAATAVWHGGVGLWAVADAALIALAANVANLLDRAPGRAGKVALVAAGVLLVATRAPSRLGPVAAMAGAAAALLAYDLRERLMLGDTGANCLGAVLGLGLVEAGGPAVRLSALTLVVALNALSEIISFGAVIERVAVLRALDQTGRRR